MEPEPNFFYSSDAIVAGVERVYPGSSKTREQSGKTKKEASVTEAADFIATIHVLLSVGFRYEEVLSMPLDLFYLHAEGARRYAGHRRKLEYIDLVSGIGGAFTKGAANKYLKALDE